MHMQELEKKAKAYDDVKKKIAMRFGSNMAEEIFSEYEMDEDEKVRKAIISGLKYLETELGWDAVGEVDILDIYTWIEKQGEQNLPSVNERAWLYLVSDVLTWKDGIGQYLDNPRVQKLAKELCSEYAQKLYNYPISSNSSNIGNNTQKPADKTEAKFHEGEWIIRKAKCFSHIIYLIKEVKDYYVCEDVKGRRVTLSFQDAHKHCRLWNISDAKEGDVLVFYSEYKGNKEEQVGIIKKYVGKHGGCSNTFSIYIGVDWENNLQIGKYMGCSDIQPATKEQRDKFMKAITDTGYTFDFEKKELKNIEKDLTEFESNMIQWKGNNLNEVIAFTGKDKNFDKWFKSFEEYEEYVHEHNDIFKLFNEDGSHYEVPVGAWIVKTPDGRNVASKAIFKNKPADWSVDDRTKVQRICGYLNEIKKYYADINEVRECIDWLKSIKERIGWKPSEEQMEALTLAIHDVHEMWYKKHLLSLKQQLKQV